MSWRQADWFVTSMSVPYMNNGTATVPDFKGFVRGVQNLGHRVIFGVLGRDQNIVRMQQQRVRGAPTLDQALGEFDNLAAPVFLSYELLHLYGHKYLESIGRQLNFPIAVNDPRITAILADDTNAKYLRSGNNYQKGTICGCCIWNTQCWLLAGVTRARTY
jgi:hypothetical protein